MGNLDNFKKAQSRKELSAKIAEIIWVSIGCIILLGGVACLVLSIVINNIGTDASNMYSSPLFFLIEAQDAFIKWGDSRMFAAGRTGTWKHEIESKNCR